LRSLTAYGSPRATASGHAAVGLLAIGALDTPVDSPSYQLLWLLVMCALAFETRAPATTRRAREQAHAGADGARTYTEMLSKPPASQP
jgi:hypothetical protein